MNEHMWVWYSAFDGNCELINYDPGTVLGKTDASESWLMIPPEGWDCD